MWSKYSNQVKVGDVFDARVGSVEDYGAFAHLKFPDGTYVPLANNPFMVSTWLRLA